MSALVNVIHEVRGPLSFEHLLAFSLHCNNTRSLDYYSFSYLQDLYLTSSLQENQSKGLNTDTSLNANPYIKVKYGYATKEGLCLIRDLSQRVICPLCSSLPPYLYFLFLTLTVHHSLSVVSHYRPFQSSFYIAIIIMIKKHNNN